MRITLSLFAICLFIGCKTVKTSGLVTEKAMVVSARVEASEIGKEILAKGGNAFDAMAATGLALAVAYPYAGNIGGGGFMVYRLNNGEVGSLDYREKAPKLAHRDMYLDSLGNVIPDMSWYGATSTGVPGSIAGIFESHRRFGKLPIEAIIQPAISLAERGVVVTRKQEKTIETYQDKIVELSGVTTLFSEAYKEGDTIKYHALARTLRRILKHGPQEFYTGETARKLIDFIQSEGGFVTMEDLKDYSPKWRKPIIFNYKDLKVISMAPPSSGGVTLAQIMKMIERYPLDRYGHNSKRTIQVITEAERRAYADRNYYLGDPDFVSVPLRELLSSEYLEDRMRDFSFKAATPSHQVSHGNVTIVESDETTHYSIVDQYGNAVSVTTTINGAYGSKLYCDELGFFLNNEMDDFSAKPGVPNKFGLTGATANSIAPEKRMLSSMTPTIVEQNGELFMVVGTPGGSTIITSVLQTILNVYEFGMSMQEAVNAARFHHQWLPDIVKMEPKQFNRSLKRKLYKSGYEIDETSSKIIGKVDAILRLESGRLEAGADHRGDDAAAGF
ncbi:gamma-glutamyltransferase [Zhouia amylolytica]|uniref:gamma-glutamyltransferase n=1 Tax=Zhouia amylolytica TaxID=376730 RepID=UPI0020CE0470|nr:gamma-glutamyltransferase [Zhouia amylolytica]MCQ0112717.1 gamma-glutamyltransferase [Zhouia amylolytica]